MSKRARSFRCAWGSRQASAWSKDSYEDQIWFSGSTEEIFDLEAYAKVSLKKYKPMAARNEDRNVSSGLL